MWVKRGSYVGHILIALWVSGLSGQQVWPTFNHAPYVSVNMLIPYISDTQVDNKLL